MGPKDSEVVNPRKAALLSWTDRKIHERRIVWYHDCDLVVQMGWDCNSILLTIGILEQIADCFSLRHWYYA